jgi:GNAT superfamily N-acetyltransferase
MSEYTVRPVEGEADNEFGVTLFNACFGEKLGVTYNIEQIREWFKAQDNPLKRNYIVEMNGQPFANMAFTEMPSEDGHRRFFCGLTIMPGHESPTLIKDLYLELFDFVAEHDPYELRIALHDFREDHIKFADRQGFERLQRDQLSSLQLDKLDFDSFAEVVTRVKDSGIRLVTLTEYEQENPDYKSALLDLHNAIYRDVPGFETVVGTLEQLEARVLQNPGMLPDAWILAMDGDQLVGMTYMSRFNDEDCLTNLTGVVRSHRRRGITTAMKVTAFKIVQDMGFKRILTNNEENNPMYQINLRFGFEPGPAVFIYARQMTAE